MSTEPAFGRLLFLTAVAGALLYCIAAQNGELALGVIVTAGVAARFSRFGSAPAAPRTIINLMLMFALGWAVRGTFDERVDVDDFCEFITLLTLVKLFDLRKPRDHAQLISLSAFLAVGAILTSNSFLLGLGSIAFAPLLIVTTMRHQLVTSAVVAHAAPRTPPRARRDLRRLAAVGLALGALSSLAVFVFLPRGLGQGAFGRWGNAAIGRTSGFTDEVELGIGGLISDSPTPVLDARFTDAHGRDAGGIDRIFYLRGAVLDEYRGGTWVRGRSPAHPDRFSESIRAHGVHEFSDAGQHDLIQSISMRNAPRNESHLFSVWRPTEIHVTQSGQRVTIGRDRQLVREGAPGRFAYTVWSDTRSGPYADADAEPRPGVGAPDRVAYDCAKAALRGQIEPDPTLRPRSRDRQAARKIEIWLRQNFTYSLETRRAPPGSDPTQWFLTDSREGHCEYFASAMAAMCRSIGIDARVITGYVAAEYNPATGSYVVRESNAHAWVEVSVGPDVWATYDPTPPAQLQTIHHPPAGPFAGIRRLWGSIEHIWNSAVVSYDASARAELLGLPDPDDSLAYDPPKLLSNLRIGGGGLALRAVINAVLVTLAVLFVGILARAALRRVLRRRRLRTSARDPEVRRLLADAGFYADALRALERRGLAKPDGRPPLDHAGRLEPTEPGVAEPLRTIARAYYHLRFAGLPLDPAQLDGARRAVAALRTR